MADPRSVAALLAYRNQSQALLRALEAYIERLWRSIGPNYRDTQLHRWTRSAVPTVIGAQQRAAALTAAYLAIQRQVALGGSAKPLPVDVTSVTGSAVRAGTAMALVYARPFDLLWRQLGAGATPEQAIAAGQSRAVQLARTDLQLTRTHTARDVMGKDGEHVVGYERVPNGDNPCALCLIASTQRYHSEDLLPIHPACFCDVAPIYGQNDPGHVIDGDLLDRVHAAVKAQLGVSDAGGRTPDYRNLIVTRTHGELGPVLAKRGAPFLGPNDLH